jgi:predicted nucleic acid-binding protein
VTLYYADTSALARAYLADEAAHTALRELLLEGPDPVLTSELSAVELAGALAAAERAGRIADAAVAMRQIDTDLGGDPVALLSLRPSAVFPLARKLVDSHPLFALDAIHLAVALAEAPSYAAAEPVVLVTCDRRQAAAATSEGLAVWEPDGT